MNKIYFNKELIDDYSNINGFKLNIEGDNNEIEINSFNGKGIVYINLIGNNCKFTFGGGTTVNHDMYISFLPTLTDKPTNSEIIIGNNNFFNGQNIKIVSSLNNSIRIGYGNLFASDITIWGRNDHIIYDMKTKKRVNFDKDIIIGNENWICDKTSFLPSGHIGNNCVVGYSSLINKTITTNNALIAGIPAEIKKKNINWSISSDYDKIDFNHCLKINE